MSRTHETDTYNNKKVEWCEGHDIHKIDDAEERVIHTEQKLTHQAN